VNRTYRNSINSRFQVGPFGRGWEASDGWGSLLSISSDGTVTITDPSGATRRFQPDSRGGFLADPGDNGTLTPSNQGGFLLAEADGRSVGFTSDGRMAYATDINGNKVSAVYTNGLLTGLTTPTRQSLTLTYNNAQRITSISDSTGRTTTYTYDS